MNEANSSRTDVRRLWLSDKEAFRDHLLSLDPRSRHLRFGGGMSDDFLGHCHAALGLRSSRQPSSQANEENQLQWVSLST